MRRVFSISKPLQTTSITPCTLGRTTCTKVRTTCTCSLQAVRKRLQVVQNADHLRLK